jgi:hypothetical protein
MALDYSNPQVRETADLYSQALRAEREFRWEDAIGLYQQCADAYEALPREAKKPTRVEFAVFLMGGGVSGLGSRACERALRLIGIEADPDVLRDLHEDWKQRARDPYLPSMSDELRRRVQGKWREAVVALEARHPFLKKRAR